MWAHVLDLIVGVAFLAAVIVPLEWAFQARPLSRLRPELLTDLGFVAIQYLVMMGLFLAFNAELQRWIGWEGPDLPLWARVPLALVAGDLGLYWGHRLSHAVPWMWRFHAVHHSAPVLDFVASHREHPLDGLWSQLTFNAPIFLLGLSLGDVMPVLVFRGVWAVLIHSNVTLPLGPLGILFGDPVLHRFHHAQDPERVVNFGNLAPYLDLLFGTHARPADERYPLGVRGLPRRGLLSHLLTRGGGGTS